MFEFAPTFSAITVGHCILFVWKRDKNKHSVSTDESSNSRETHLRVASTQALCFNYPGPDAPSDEPLMVINGCRALLPFDVYQRNTRKFMKGSFAYATKLLGDIYVTLYSTLAHIQFVFCHTLSSP